MAGLFVQLILSWLLLRLLFKQGLQPLGLAPTKDRLLQCALGFVITAGCCTLYYLGFTAFNSNTWCRPKHIRCKQTWQRCSTPSFLFCMKNCCFVVRCYTC